MQTKLLLATLLGLAGVVATARAQDSLNVSQVGKLYNLWDAAKAVTVRDRYAYVAAYRSGLHILDVQDPTMPTEVGFYDTPGHTWQVLLSGDHAYVADGDSGLRVINVADVFGFL